MEDTMILGAETGDMAPAEPAMMGGMNVIGEDQLRKWTEVLNKYQAGKKRVEARIIAAENWWKLRNTIEERKEGTQIGKDGAFTARSGWLHNVIASKHADAMEAYPEPNILPREQGDKDEARMLSSIIPCVLERNGFEAVYDAAMWSKGKYGTGIYKVVWDSRAQNGLGEIAISEESALNVFWEPKIRDIQKSRYLFHTESVDKDLLIEEYPQLEDKLKNTGFVTSQFPSDESNQEEANKATVIEVYYHKGVQGRSTLQYCKYVGETVLYATENEPEWAQRGLYDHGKYPYVFDPLFPVEDSPCGYGYVDLCQNPQIVIDLMRTASVKNAMVGTIPRYFTTLDGSVNEEELLDLSNPIVHVTGGNLTDQFIKLIQHTPLDGNYLNLMNSTIEELREVSGNTETSTGNISSGVTAASAIAALQQAAGKGSRDATAGSYRAYTKIVELCIELIRQFYDMPRWFRIVGEYGAQQFVSYSNAGIKPQPFGNEFGMDMGYRLPVFDIKISAQKKNVYTKVTQNELALQFYDKGFFDPMRADQALMCLDMMEFDGKDELMQRISNQAMLTQKLMQYMEMALGMAQICRPDLVPLIQEDMMATQAQLGQAMQAAGMGNQMVQSDNIAGVGKKEPAIVENARARSAAASQPTTDAVTRGSSKK